MPCEKACHVSYFRLVSKSAMSHIEDGHDERVVFCLMVVQKCEGENLIAGCTLCLKIEGRFDSYEKMGFCRL